MTNLRFHWMLPQAGEGAMKTPQSSARYRVEQTLDQSPASTPDITGWTSFAHEAERAGIESVLISFSRHEPDPMLIACALGQFTKRLKFIIACRSGLIKPTAFVQQVNTLSTLIQGRIALNFVAGSSTPEQHAYGDFLDHDERYERASEYLQICADFWNNPASEISYEGKHYRIDQALIPTPFANLDRKSPEIYVAGHSPQAEELVVSRGTCWLRGADTPENLKSIVDRSRQNGIEVGLRLCVLSRPTQQEAIDVAESLVPECEIGMWSKARDSRDDSVMYRQSDQQKDAWISPDLWTGLVSLCGPVWTTLIGTPETIADALIEYKRIGITQFIMSGWPETDQVIRFGKDVIPLIREAEVALE